MPVLHGLLEASSQKEAASYRFAWPRTIFFTLRLADPRAYVRFFSGLVVARFFRAVRFAFFRSSFDIAFVLAMSSRCL